jgi:hypothetical protein
MPPSHLRNLSSAPNTCTSLQPVGKKVSKIINTTHSQ